MRKVAATFEFENSLWNQNKKYIVGIDEVGRGAWAGPLVAAAVIFPQNHSSKYKFFDSKLLTAQERSELSVLIQRDASSFGIGEVEVAEVETLGLTKATQLAYERALEKLDLQPEHYLIDAFYLQSMDKENQTPIIHGDFLCSSIAAASIIAKVYRDQLMRSLPKAYRPYKFSNNKGYGTAEHQAAILRYGLTDLHRHNYNLKILQ